MPMPILVSQPATVGRKLRNPAHTFNLKYRPFQIQPFLIAPVLPAETLKSAFCQARTLTDPIANQLCGWWSEYWLFYVKLRDLAGREDFVDLMLELNKDINTAQTAAAKVQHYHAAASGVDYVGQCLARVVDEYFRDEGKLYTDHTIDGMPGAKVKGKHWLDSVKDEDAWEAYGAADATVKPNLGEIDTYFTVWQQMHATQVIDMSFEEWLATYGVQMPKKEEAYRPELIRHWSDWQYPSNTVTSAGVKSAVSFATSFRADKDKFFKEPGFIFGVTCMRPKVYFRSQTESGVSMLDTALAWLPALMRDEPFTSLRKYAATAGPITVTMGDAYVVDVRDLFVHGDQFMNYAPAINPNMYANTVQLPAGAFQVWYPDSDDVDKLFVDTTATIGSCYTDGVIQLNILGTQMDHTPRLHPDSPDV